MRLRTAVSLLLMLAGLATWGCRSQNPVTKNADGTLQVGQFKVREVTDSSMTESRESELRLKERCAVAGERFDKLFPPQNFAASRTNETSVSEVFYSPQRNSCVCE